MDLVLLISCLFFDFGRDPFFLDVILRHHLGKSRNFLDESLNEFTVVLNQSSFQKPDFKAFFILVFCIIILAVIVVVLFCFLVCEKMNVLSLILEQFNRYREVENRLLYDLC